MSSAASEPEFISLPTFHQVIVTYLKDARSARGAGMAPAEHLGLWQRVVKRVTGHDVSDFTEIATKLDDTALEAVKDWTRTNSPDAAMDRLIARGQQTFSLEPAPAPVLPSPTAADDFVDQRNTFSATRVDEAKATAVRAGLDVAAEAADATLSIGAYLHMAGEAGIRGDEYGLERSDPALMTRDSFTNWKWQVWALVVEQAATTLSTGLEQGATRP